MTNHYKNKPPKTAAAVFITRHRWMRASLFLTVALICSISFAQAQTVTGLVKSKANEPLPGVSVVVKGTTTGTTTDADGKYAIQVNGQNATLVFTFIGFKPQEVPVSNRSEVNVDMEQDVTELNEVVVTALGISQEKRGLGYGVQDVKGEDVANTQRSNFLVSLQGRVAGLSMTPTSGLPGASVSINLRGVNSIGGSNQPLIVVDGLITNNQTFSQHAMVSDLDNRSNDYTNRSADINPNDIESITILKGPEAAALYGQDGASGAIIITTKRAKSGEGKIEYDNSFGFQKVYRFPEVQQVYGLGFNGVTNPLGTGLSTTFFGAKIAEGTKLYDNKEQFFKTGTSQTHNISFEGGSEKSTYRLSTNYTDQNGTVPSSEYKKLSVRLGSTAQLMKNLEAVSSFNYILSDNKKPIRGQYGFLNNVLEYPVYDDMTQYLNVDGSRRKLTAYENEYDNPFFSVNKNQNRDRTNRLLANLQLNYTPLSWLTVTGRFGGDIYSTLGTYFLNPESFNGSGSNVGGRIAKGSVDNYSENSRLLNGMLLTTAKKDFGKFKTSLMVGGAVDDNKYEVNSMKGEKLIIPDFNSLNNTDPSTQRNKNTITQKRVLGLLGNMTVNYQDLVYLTLSGRNDWSSTMPIANRSYFYPSAALSFVFSELAAVRNLSFLSFGKVRASYAEVGKDAPAYFVNPSLDSRFSTGGGYAYGFYGGNATLKPERSKGNEVGMELKFFERRLGLDVNVYKNDRIDQIVSQRLSYGTGFVFGLINGGSYSNRGLEVQLSGIPVQTQDFEWNILVNFTKTKTKVLSLPADVVEYYNSDTWLYGNARGSAFAPANVIQAYYPTTNISHNLRGAGSATAIGGNSYLRNDRGDILINPASGLPILNTNFLPIGDRNSKYLVGVTNSLKYKNVSLSFLLDFRRGGDVFNGNEMFLFRNGLSTRSLDREQPRIIKGVLKDGNENSETPTPNTIVVNPYVSGVTASDGGTSNSYYNAIPESEFVERDINWLRLRDVTLRYQLPTSVLNSMKVVKSASVFVSGTDLLLITNYSGADPGVNGTTPATGGAGAFGIDFGSLALPRSVTFGLHIGL